MDGLSSQLIVHILTFVDAESINNFGITCHKFNCIASNNIIWGAKLLESFPWINQENIPIKAEECKSFFKRFSSNVETATKLFGSTFNDIDPTVYKHGYGNGYEGHYIRKEMPIKCRFTSKSIVLDNIDVICGTVWGGVGVGGVGGGGVGGGGVGVGGGGGIEDVIFQLIIPEDDGFESVSHLSKVEFEEFLTTDNYVRLNKLSMDEDFINECKEMGIFVNKMIKS